MCIAVGVALLAGCEKEDEVCVGCPTDRQRPERLVVSTQSGNSETVYTYDEFWRLTKWELDNGSAVITWENEFENNHLVETSFYADDPNITGDRSEYVYAGDEVVEVRRSYTLSDGQERPDDVLKNIQYEDGLCVGYDGYYEDELYFSVVHTFDGKQLVRTETYTYTPDGDRVSDNVSTYTYDKMTNPFYDTYKSGPLAPEAAHNVTRITSKSAFNDIEHTYRYEYDDGWPTKMYHTMKEGGDETLSETTYTYQ